MDRLEYLFGVSLSPKTSKKLNAGSLFPATTPEMLESWYQKDAFTADGKPVVYNADTIYPVYAPRYLQQMLPSSLLDVDPTYRKTASVAAIQWLEKLLYLPETNTHHFDGESFETEVNGVSYSFFFPLSTITYSQHVSDPSIPTSLTYRRCTAAILPFPDSRDNDDDWQGSVIPSYAESQARLLLWCWRQSCEEFARRAEYPEICYIVRITGNTPGDVTIRTIHSDPAKENALVLRVCKAISKAKATGTDLAAAPLRKEQGTWFERKTATVASAYQVNEQDLYNLVADYMTLVTIQKTKEAEAKQIKEQEECIAIRLAALTSPAASKGAVADPNNKLTYTVTHTRKNAKQATVSASLVRQFFPEHIDCITVNEIPRGKITIEAN